MTQPFDPQIADVVVIGHKVFGFGSVVEHQRKTIIFFKVRQILGLDRGVKSATEPGLNGIEAVGLPALSHFG